MTALEDRQQIVNLLEDALARVSEATSIEQRLTHQPHTNAYLRDIQNRLEWQLNIERAMLKRLQTVGR